MDTGQTDGINQGGLKWIAEIDYSKLQQDARDIQATLGRIGDSTKTEAAGITRAINATGTAAKRQMTELDRIGSRLTGLVAGITSVAMFKNFAETVANVRSQMEAMQNSFESLLGDAQKGDQLFSDIKHMAATTPLSMDSLAQAAQTMLAFNISGEKIMPMLRALGDISMGDSARFQSLALAFSQMTSAGHLMAQDLRQMISAGFNPLQEMARTTGKSIAELTDEMSKGQISAQQVEQAFISATSQGGRFFGMLEKQSKGIRGAIQQFRSAWEEMLNDIGKSNEGPMVKAVELGTEMVKHYKTIATVLSTLIAAYGAYKTVLIVNNALEATAALQNRLHTVALTLLAKSETLAAAASAQHSVALGVEATAAKTAAGAVTALSVAAKATPYLLIIGLLVAWAKHLYDLYHQYDLAGKASKMLADASTQCASKFSSEMVTVNQLFGRLKAAKQGTQEYYQARQAILNQYPEIARSQNAHIRNLEDVAGAYNLVRNNALQAAQAEAYEAYTQNVQQEYQSEYSKNFKTIDKYINKHYKGNDGVVTPEGYELRARLVTQMAEGKRAGSWEREHYGNGMADAIDRGADLTIGNIRSQKAGQKEFPMGYQKTIQDQRQDNTVTLPPTANPGAGAGTAKTGGGSSESKADIAREAQERQQAILDAKQDIMKTQRDAELEIRQQKIDLMDDSLDKTLAKNQLDIDRLKAQNEDRLQDYVKQYTALRKAQWEQANPDAEKQGKTFEKDSGFDINKLIQKNADGTLKSNDKLLQSMLAQYNAYGKVIRQTQVNQQKETYKQLLDGVETEQQQRADIIAKWDARIAQLKEAAKVKGSGITQANVDMAEASKNWQVFQNSAQYLNFFNATLAESREQIEKAGREIKANLDQSLQKGAISAKDYEEEMEKINQILQQSRDRVSDLRSLMTGGLQGMFSNQYDIGEAKFNKSVQDYSKASDDYAAALKTGDTAAAGQAQSAMKSAAAQKAGASAAMKGASGAMSTVGTIDTVIQSINGTVQGIYGSFQQIKEMADSFGKDTGANTGWGKAESFLDAFSKASQGATDAWNSLKSGNVAGVFTGVTQSITSWFTTFNQWHDKRLQERIEKYQKQIDAIGWQIDNSSAALLARRVGEASDNVQKAYQRASASVASMGNGLSRAQRAQEILTRQAKQLADYYIGLDYSADKAFGNNRYTETIRNSQKLARQMTLIQQQIDSEQRKKKKNKDQILKWQEELDEKAKEIQDNMSDMVEEIVGKSSNDIASGLGDAFISAFTKGEDAAQAWGDKVNDIVADILKRMLVQKFLEEPLGKLFDKYKKQWFPNGDGTNAIDNVMRSLPQFESDLDGLESNFSKVVGQLPEKYKKQLESINGTTVEASQKGIAQASQDTVDELNGRMTAVQEHTYNINANTKTIAANTHALLLSVMNIESETSGMGARLRRMEASLATIGQAMSDMSVKGVTLKTRI